MFRSSRQQTAQPSSGAAEWTPPTWEELVRDHSEQVYRLAYRLTGNRPDAEDLTQDVFVRVFKSIHNFTPGTLEGWMHRITTNLFLDSARRKQRIRMDPMAEASERVASGELSPGELYDEASMDADVAAALAALAPEYRVCVVLCDIEGLSYDEIAQVLDVKIGTVRSRIHRGRSQLREALSHRRPTPDRERYLGLSAIRDEVVELQSVGR
ncbi:MAG: RNA polymerase sigma factor SigE [Luteococcus sp.]|uniref:RNA polymerase sigma factor SigE n=1 Tax=Luteococcus sp. TaxID=1969402 RepID=UPI002647A924|nr:RNA polymerase sigma factor SigE [Luteococcus sp.]MDN5564863.1 RNA polymerase sigma factor SigE [Luteococcus sp.]